MKRHFLAGIAAILPLFITIFIIKWIINFLTAPFLGLTESFVDLMIRRYPFLAIFETPEITLIYSQLLILCFLFFVIVLVGFLAERIFMLTAFRAFDQLIHKIPLINTVYKSVQDIIHTFFSDNRPAFSSPVQIPFSKTGANALAFVTNETVQLPLDREFSALYMPSPPNPMLGFLVLMPKDKIIKTPLSAERSIQFIASCGVIKI